MVTSGGYLRETASIVAESILNLKRHGLISCDKAEGAVTTESNGEDIKASGKNAGNKHRCC